MWFGHVVVISAAAHVVLVVFVVRGCLRNKVANAVILLFLGQANYVVMGFRSDSSSIGSIGGT